MKRLAAVLGGLAVVVMAGCSGGGETPGADPAGETASDDPATSRLAGGLECIIVPAYPPGDPQHDPEVVSLLVPSGDASRPEIVAVAKVGSKAIVVTDDGPLRHGAARRVMVAVEEPDGGRRTGKVGRGSLRPVK